MRARLAFAFVLWLGSIAETASATSVLVASHLSNELKLFNQFDFSTDFVGNFATGLPSHPIDMVGSPDGSTVYVSLNNGEIHRFQHGGTPLGSFDTSLSLGALGVGPGGDLYAAIFSEDRVARFDSATGAYLGDFVAPGSGGLDGPSGVLFQAGTLYVTSRDSGQVLAYDGSTGAFEGVFATPGSNGPTELTFGPGGDLFVINVGTGTVQRFDGTTGTFLGDFADPSGITEGADLMFGGGGDSPFQLFVSSPLDSNVQRFDAVTGAPLGSFGGNGLSWAAGLYGGVPVPEPGTGALLALGLVALAGRRSH